MIHGYNITKHFYLTTIYLLCTFNFYAKRGNILFFNLSFLNNILIFLHFIILTQNIKKKKKIEIKLSDNHHRRNISIWWLYYC